MADAAAGVANAAARPVVNYARHQLVEIYKDHYIEADVKAVLLNELQQIQDGMKILLNVDFRTARDKIEHWLRSEESIESPSRRECLSQASECAAKAFNTVTDPLDKVTAAFFVIFTGYHLAALNQSPPDWAAGKREAQILLEQYVKKMPQLDTAAAEELRPAWGRKLRRSVFKDKEKRRTLLQSFVTLSFTVYEFAPSSGNDRHPRFENLENASAKMMDSKNLVASIVSPKIGYLVDKPCTLIHLEGHNYRVWCVAVYCNGTRAISGSGDTTLKVWDLSPQATPHCLYTLEGHNYSVKCVAVYCNGTRAISGGWDGTLKVWDLSPQATQHCLYTLEGHNDSVNCVAVYCNGTRAISGSHDETLKVWDLSPHATEPCLYTLEGHKDWVRCVAVYCNGTRAISGSSDKTLKVWDLSPQATQRCLYTLEGHKDVVRCVDVFANGTRAVSGSFDKTLKIWQLPN